MHAFQLLRLREVGANPKKQGGAITRDACLNNI